MKLNKYQKLAERTMNANSDLANMGLGLGGETGEVLEILKKHLYHGHPLDKEALVKEMGDVLWYLAGLATLLDVSMEDVARGNIIKLQGRYPEGFVEKKGLTIKGG